MRRADDDLSDAQLLEQSVDDVALFGQLYDRHVQSVLAYFVRRTGCGQTAADLTSETFASAFTSRHRFSDIGAPAEAWLFRIAQRQLGRFQRRERVATRARRRLGVQRLELDAVEIERVEHIVDEALLHAEVAAAVAQLPASLSEAVNLRIGEGLSYEEVSRRLGCSPGAARVRVSRGLTRLAELMGAKP
jgi:RNA polymerase sigma factor (sigma-70 family)